MPRGAHCTIEYPKCMYTYPAPAVCACVLSCFFVVQATSERARNGLSQSTSLKADTTTSGWSTDVNRSRPASRLVRSSGYLSRTSSDIRFWLSFHVSAAYRPTAVRVIFVYIFEPMVVWDTFPIGARCCVQGQ